MNKRFYILMSALFFFFIFAVSIIIWRAAQYQPYLEANKKITLQSLALDNILNSKVVAVRSFLDSLRQEDPNLETFIEPVETANNLLVATKDLQEKTLANKQLNEAFNTMSDNIRKAKGDDYTENKAFMIKIRSLLDIEISINNAIYNYNDAIRIYNKRLERGDFKIISKKKKLEPKNPILSIQ